MHYDIENTLSDTDAALEDIICLVAVIYSLFDSDIDSFLGLPSHNGRGLKLSPSASLDEAIVEGLVERNILRLVESTSCDVNQQYREGTLQLVVPEGVSEATDYLSSLESSLSVTKSPMKNAAVVKLCEEIGIHECLSFFDYAMNYHHISFKVGTRTKSILVRGLKSYSVGQLCSLMWSVVKGLVTAKRTRAKSYYHMAKYADLALGRMIDKAITGPWCVTQFHRPSSLPQSQLSYVVFTMLLQSKDDGYGFTLARRGNCRLKVGTLERKVAYDPFQKINDRETLIVFLQDVLETGNPRYIFEAFNRLAPAIERLTGVRIGCLAEESVGLESFFEVLSLLDLRINVFSVNQDN